MVRGANNPRYKVEFLFYIVFLHRDLSIETTVLYTMELLCRSGSIIYTS